MWVLKHRDTGRCATLGMGESDDLQKARTYDRKSSANQSRYNYVQGVRSWQDPAKFDAEKAKWIATEVFLAEASTATPAPPPPPPAPEVPEDPFEAAGLIFRLPGT